MPITKIKPTGNARRQLSYLDTKDLSKSRPVKSLTITKKRKSGRNDAGQIVVYGKGGGAKKLLRLVDFKQIKFPGMKAKVLQIEYDPFRTANIALIEYENGSKDYILAPVGLKTGASIVSDEKAPAKLANRMKLKNIPVGTIIYSVEVTGGKGGQICRSAGNFATLLGADGKYVSVRLPSGEVRRVLSENYASIGVVSNPDKFNVVIGKAGRSRHLGKKPTVRGKAKNPCDHPHGGGEGGTSIGLKYPKTPWGKPALGPKTRNKKKQTSQLILSRRTK